MQQPTLRGVRVRSSQDVHRIFYGVQIGRLKMLERRLDNEEREALTSGCVYVWEERGSRNVDVTGEGMDRFTEGKQWGPSRVRDDFLFYTQKTKLSSTHACDRLIKQTYSAWFDTPTGRRKWHLTAYFSDSTIDDLCTIDELPVLQDIQPPDIFECAKSNKSKSRRRQSGKLHSQESNSSASPQDPHVSLTFSSEPVTMMQPYIARESKPLVAHPLPPIQPPPTYGASNPIEDMSNNSKPWSTLPVQSDSALNHGPSRHRFSLPPFNTFIYADDLSSTPVGSETVSPSTCWVPYPELSSCSERYRDSTRALAPIYGPRRRIYFRDPLDEKVLRRLAR